MEKKLKKVIEYAVENGWTYANGAEFAVDKVVHGWDITIFNDDGMVTTELFTILFSHDFAKAVFGEKPTCSFDGSEFSGLNKIDQCKLNGHAPWDVFVLEAWEYHLQQAVISEDPIEYYFDYIVDLT